MAVIGELLEAYGDLVTRRPILTQVMTAGIISITADIIAQQLIERRKSHDFQQTTIMAICGFLYFGPSVSCWYTLLSSYEFSTIVNVLLDQFVCSPVLLAGFLVLQTFLQGHGMREVRRRLSHEFFPLLKANWMLWIPIQLINFKLIPYQYRMLFSQVIVLFWNCYVCLQTSQAGPKDDGPQVTKDKKESL